jgi:ribose transport system ATP-binding protein
LREHGVAMIYVSHRLDEIMDISDRAAVMRDGRLVGIRATAQASAAELVELIVGSKFDASLPKARGDGTRTVLALDEVYSANAGPVTLQAGGGEVLGLIGLRGAGHEAIGRLLFGLSGLERGRILLDGRPVAPGNPAQAIRLGIGLVAADRLQENLGGNLSVQENLFPNPALTLGTLTTRLAPHGESAEARRLIRRFDVNPPEPQAEVQNLSGGNQQKVVLARWMSLELPLLILEEPTAGVDVGAKRQIYEILRQQADAGVCVLVISTDFEEVANVCTRAMVFRGGAVACELKGASLSVAGLLVAAAGVGGTAKHVPASTTEAIAS